MHRSAENLKDRAQSKKAGYLRDRRGVSGQGNEACLAESKIILFGHVSCAVHSRMVPNNFGCCGAVQGLSEESRFLKP